VKSLPSFHAGHREDYDRWHGQLASADALDTPWHALLQRHLEPSADLAGKVMLEIACGRGDLAVWCAQASTPPAHLVAADFSQEAVRITAARFDAKDLSGQVMQMDAQRLPLRDGSIDTLISCETLEHLPNPKAALSEFARVLGPGGRLFLTTPNYLGPMGAYRLYLRLLGRRYSEDGQPVNRFLVGPRTRRWVRQSGLTVRCVDGQGHYFLWPGKRPIKLDISSRILVPFAFHSLVVAEKPQGRHTCGR
jgi:ubiquinone/menaquinone biosynthesis C-methylase UbiE